MKARGEISAEMLITIWRWDLVSALQHHIAIRWAELIVEGLFQDWNDLLAMILGKRQFITALLHMHELIRCTSLLPKRRKLIRHNKPCLSGMCISFVWEKGNTGRQ